MKMVIDIPEKIYKRILNNEYDYGDINIIIQNGTLLPKGHGRLIDADELVSQAEVEDLYGRYVHGWGWVTCRKVQMFIGDAPTVIEADKGCEQE